MLLDGAPEDLICCGWRGRESCKGHSRSTHKASQRLVCPNITHFACQLFFYISTKACVIFQPCEGITGIRILWCAIRQLTLHALKIAIFLFQLFSMPCKYVFLSLGGIYINSQCRVHKVHIGSPNCHAKVPD